MTLSLFALLVIVAVVAAILWVRREQGTGGRFGLSVEEKANVLKPFAGTILATTKPAGFLGLGGSVTIHARALVAWAHWKYGYNSPDARAWGIAAAWARDRINDERQDPGRFLAEIVGLVVAFVGAVTGGAAGLGAWAAYIGGTAIREAERNEKVRAAYVNFINQQVRNRDQTYNEFIRFLYCSEGAASFWISNQPTRANVAKCARLAIMSEPERPGFIARNGVWTLPGGSLTGG